jgi:hypothetical protein
MESVFKTSFADVRVHVGPQAAAVGAVAFTQGSNVYFAPGQYNPQTPQGRKLLGHELAHVVQQRRGRVNNPFGSGVAVVRDPRLEAEAEQMGIRASMHAVPVQAKLAAKTTGFAPCPNPAPARGYNVAMLRVALSQTGRLPQGVLQRFAATPVRRGAIQRMLGTGVGLESGSPPLVDLDALKRKAVAEHLRAASRLDWRVDDKRELALEVATYAKELRAHVEQAVAAKASEVNQRHKTAWDTLANGLARAVELNNPDIANAVIAVSGSWHHRPLKADDARWGQISMVPESAVKFLQDVGRNALNVYTGLASVNKGQSSGFDAHRMGDLLGLKKVHDSSDGTSTPFSTAVSNVPSAGLFSGETPLTQEHLKGLLAGSVEHYKRLHALSDEEGQGYYGRQIKSLMATPWAMEALSEGK